MSVRTQLITVMQMPTAATQWVHSNVRVWEDILGMALDVPVRDTYDNQSSVYFH